MQKSKSRYYMQKLHVTRLLIFSLMAISVVFFAELSNGRVFYPGQRRPQGGSVSGIGRWCV